MQDTGTLPSSLLNWNRASNVSSVVSGVRTTYHDTKLYKKGDQPKINCMLITRLFAYNESLQHPTIAVLLIKILIFWQLSCVHSFQSNQHFQAIEFMDRHVSKALNLIFPKLSLQNIHSSGYARILIPSFPWSPLGTPGTMTHLLCHKYKEKWLADYESRCLTKRD